MSTEKDKDINDSLDLAAQMAAAGDVVDRYGSAVKEHYVAYSGRDNEFDRNLKRGLKKTAESKVHPDFQKQNLRQQAGYSAEDKYTARKNSEEIISGSKRRYSRTDDVGRVNDQLFDHVMLDENGVEIIGSGEQMKFVGNSPKDCLGKLKSDCYQKYIDADAKLTVPSDYYEGILEEANREISSLAQQLTSAKKNGDVALAEQIDAKIKKLRKIRKNLNNSGISNKEAMEARLSPKLSTAKDVLRVAHRAGMAQMTTGATIAGSVSLIRNIVGVCKGEVSATDAAIALAKDTATGAVTAYTTAFAGSAVKGAMQNSANSMVRCLAKTNLPAMVVTATVDIGKTMIKFFKGEIDGLECLQQLGEKGTSSLSSAMFAAAGQALIPVPVVGAVVGSMVGYALSASFYGQLISALKEEKLSYQRRLEAERQCEETLRMIADYRKEMDAMLARYFSELKTMIDSSLSGMETAFKTNNIDLFIEGANVVTTTLSDAATFQSFEEFDDFMYCDESLKL